MAKKQKRDYQRSRVYKSEHALGLGKKFYSVKGIQDYVSHFVNSQWWRKRFNIEYVLVTSIRRSSNYAYSMIALPKVGTIWIPKDMFRELVILHELAHLVVPEDEPMHGKIFAGTYLKLVQKKMGKEKRDQLLRQYEKNKVKWEKV